MNIPSPLRFALLPLICFAPQALAQVPAVELSIFSAREQSLSDAIAQNPNSLSLLSHRGDIRQFSAKFSDAVSDYEKMIALDPAQDAPHWRLGIAYYFAGSYVKAAKQFEKYHAHDGGDRENGVWKFMSQAQAEGIDAARKGMLEYKRFDREPFPALYEMFAGKLQPEDVLKHLADKQLEDRTQVVFFAKYYVGVYLTLTGKKAEGLRLIDESVSLFTPDTAGQGGPGYMWQVARLHSGVLKKEPASAPVQNAGK